MRPYRIALSLAIFTIVYNLGEGVLSTWFGIRDEAVTLFGFGVDSFVEVISGVGIAHMIYRLERDPNESRDRFERAALRVTGTSFYILVAGLLVSAVVILIQDHRPVTTLWGLIISVASILIMSALMYSKLQVGKQLGSQAIIADARCTRVCLLMSVVLLVASGIYEMVHIPYIDAAGASGLAYFSWSEGRECFEKAESPDHGSC